VEDFLRWVGAYNVLGALLLMLMHFDRVADVALRVVTEVVPQPYRHEGYARMWLWWAAMTNLFLGVVMVRAADWPPSVQREVIVCAIGVYLIGWFAVRGPDRSPSPALRARDLRAPSAMARPGRVGCLGAVVQLAVTPAVSSSHASLL